MGWLRIGYELNFKLRYAARSLTIRKEVRHMGGNGWRGAGVGASANTGLSERGSVGRVMKLVRKGVLEECWGRVFCSPRSVHREVRERDGVSLRNLEQARRECQDRERWKLFCRGHPLVGAPRSRR